VPFTPRLDRQTTPAVAGAESRATKIVAFSRKPLEKSGSRS
jgi:hypothetical protein